MSRTKPIELSWVEVSNKHIEYIIDEVKSYVKKGEKLIIVLYFDNGESEDFDDQEKFKKYISSLGFEGYGSVKELNVSTDWRNKPDVKVSIRPYAIYGEPGVRVQVITSSRDEARVITENLTKTLRSFKTYNWVLSGFLCSIITSIVLAGCTYLLISNILHLQIKDTTLITIIITIGATLIRFIFEKLYPKVSIIDAEGKRVGRTVKGDFKWVLIVVGVGFLINFLSAKLFG